MYPLGKAEFCSKLRVCLQPLALETGGRVRSMQISTLPLTLDLHHEGTWVEVWGSGGVVEVWRGVVEMWGSG